MLKLYIETEKSNNQFFYINIKNFKITSSVCSTGNNTCSTHGHNLNLKLQVF